MRDSLKKGDIITTIGGVVGKIVAVTNDTIVIETSEDRVRIEFTKWAVSNVGVQTGEQPSKDSKDSRRRRRKCFPRIPWMRSLPPRKNPRRKVIKSGSPGICLFESVFPGEVFFMGNGKRTPRKPWVVFGRALALSLGIYLAGHLLLGGIAGPGHSRGGGSLCRHGGAVCDRLCGRCLLGSGAGGNGTPPRSHVGRGALCVRSDRGRCSGLGRGLPGRDTAASCCYVPWPAAFWQACWAGENGAASGGPLTEDYGENSQKGLRRWLTLPRNAAGGGPSENPQMWGFIAKTTQDPVLFDAISRNGGIFVSTVYIIMFT